MDVSRNIKILLIIFFLIILITAIGGEIMDSVLWSGYSKCDFSKVTDLDCRDDDGIDKSVGNIFELIELYKCNVIWRKIFLISVIISALYFCIYKDEINFKSYTILLIVIFLLSYQLHSYLIFHSYQPISRLIKNNLESINKKTIKKIPVNN